jgi:hypothetical protein
MSRKTDAPLNVTQAVKDFQREEKSSADRKETFKIEKPFDEDLNTILKAKPGRSERKEKGR